MWFCHTGKWQRSIESNKEQERWYSRKWDLGIQISITVYFKELFKESTHQGGDEENIKSNNTYCKKDDW